MTVVNSYNLNNKFIDNTGHKITTALSKLSTTINNNLDDNSVIQNTTVSGNQLIVKAKIAGSDGNNILTTSACQNAVWSKAYNKGYTLANGTDATAIQCISAIKTAINNITSKSYEIINNSNPNIITIQYKTIGNEGNVPISSAAYNASWDNSTLSGGRSELQVGETIYYNSDLGQIKSSLQDSNDVYRYDCWNGVRLSLMPYSINRLTVNGDCKIKFRYRYVLLND